MKVTDYERVNSVQDSDVLLIDGNRGTKTIYVDDLGFVNEEEYESDKTEYEEDIYGVNLIPYPYAYDSQTIDGVTWIVNADGSVKANGTNTGTGNSYFRLSNIGDVTLKAGVSYILSLPEASEYINLRVYNDTEGWSYLVNMSNKELLIIPTADITGKIALRANKGATISNVTCHPMLRKATIKDDTYRPFNQQSIQHQLTEQTNVLGAKNLLDDSPFATQVVNGVTYTKNTDGTISVTGTVAGGQTFAHAEFITTESLPAGSYIYTDKVNKEHAGTIIRLDNSSGTVVASTLTGQNIHEFTLTESHKLNVRFYRDNNETGNYTIKPMLRLASDPDNTYVPYAMTNRDLTEKVGFETAQISKVVGDTSVTFSNSAIKTTSELTLLSENSSNTPIFYTAVTVSNGSATYTFPALTVATKFSLKVR